MVHLSFENKKFALTFGLSLLVVIIGTQQLIAQKIYVSPVDELEILDPRVDSEGKPIAILEPAAGLIKGQDVVIPPFVVVHKQYYTGDRDFRAQNFPGGPCILILSHPYTGEKLRLEVAMLPGAPRVTYRRQYIDYDFGGKRIRIRFCHPLRLFHKYEPTVRVLDGCDFCSKQDPHCHPSQIARWIDDTGLPAGVGQVVHATGSIANSSAQVIRTSGEIVTRPIKLVVQSTPLNGLFTSDQSAELKRGIRVQEELAEEYSEVYEDVPIIR